MGSSFGPSYNGKGTMKAVILLSVCILATIFSVDAQLSPLAQRQFDAIMARLAVDSYKNQQPNNRVRRYSFNGTCTPFELVKFIDVEKTDTEVYIHKNEDLKAVFVSWRGTETHIKDLLTDANAFPSNCTIDGDYFGTIHLGFCKSYTSARTKVQLQDYPSDYRIFISGHSLGGALAVLHAYDLALAGRKVERLVTLGQPRIGFKNFITNFKSLNIPYTRFVRALKSPNANIKDVVTKIPPTPFVHAVDETVLTCSVCETTAIDFTVFGLHFAVDYFNLAADRTDDGTGRVCWTNGQYSGGFKSNSNAVNLVTLAIADVRFSER